MNGVMTRRSKFRNTRLRNRIIRARHTEFAAHTFYLFIFPAITNTPSTKPRSRNHPGIGWKTLRAGWSRRVVRPCGKRRSRASTKVGL